MRKIVAMLIIGAVAVPASAQVGVRGHFRSDGTYVQPHVRSAPNNSRTDNWSSQGNYNPYTGRQGTVDPYRAPSMPTYRPYTPPQPQQYQAPKPLYQPNTLFGPQRCRSSYGC